MITTLLSIDNSSSGRYSPVAAAKSAAGLRIPEFDTAHNRAQRGFFVCGALAHLSMVAQAGASSEAPGSVSTGNANSVWATTNHGFASVGGELLKLAHLPPHHFISILNLLGLSGYILSAIANSIVGLRILKNNPRQTRLKRVFLSVHIHSMVAQAGASTEAPVNPWVAGNANPVWATTNHGFASVGGSYKKHTQEAAIMATIPAIAQPEITVINGQATTTSFAIAEYFHKRHSDVLRKIESLECSEKFTSTHFCVHVENIRAGAVSRDSKYYRITRDGFAFLAMGFTGKRAAQFKEAYINAFNEMEAALTRPALPDLRSASHNAGVVAEYLNIIHRAWCKNLYPMLVAADSPLAIALNDRICDAATLASFVKSDIDHAGRH